MSAAAMLPSPVVVCALNSAEPDLIVALRAIARRDGNSALAIAKAIGVDHALLYRALKRPHARDSRLGIVTCAKLVQAYPDLSDPAARYLAEVHGWDTVRALAALGLAARRIGGDGA